MPFRVLPSKPPSLRERRRIRQAVQNHFITKVAKANGAKNGSCVRTETGFAVELPGGQRVPLESEDSVLLTDAYAWEKSGEGDPPKIRI